MPTDTRIPVPVEGDPLFVHLPDPNHVDARRRLPDSRTGASVPVIGLAAIKELHPLVGVRHGRILELSRQRG